MILQNEKWNESGFRPPLCTYRLNWARRTSWGWWDDWDDTVLQTQDSKFEPWRSEAEHATSRSRRLPTILTFTRGWGRNIFVSFKPPRPGTEPRTLAWKAAVLTTTLGPPPKWFSSHSPPPPPTRCLVMVGGRWCSARIQQTQDVESMLAWDDAPVLNQHWLNVTCLLGTRTFEYCLANVRNVGQTLYKRRAIIQLFQAWNYRCNLHLLHASNCCSSITMDLSVWR